MCSFYSGLLLQRRSRFLSTARRWERAALLAAACPTCFQCVHRLRSWNSPAERLLEKSPRQHTGTYASVLQLKTVGERFTDPVCVETAALHLPSPQSASAFGSCPTMPAAHLHPPNLCSDWLPFPVPLERVLTVGGGVLDVERTSSSMPKWNGIFLKIGKTFQPEPRQPGDEYETMILWIPDMILEARAGSVLVRFSLVRCV